QASPPLEDYGPSVAVAEIASGDGERSGSRRRLLRTLAQQADTGDSGRVRIRHERSKNTDTVISRSSTLSRPLITFAIPPVPLGATAKLIPLPHPMSRA